MLIRSASAADASVIADYNRRLALESEGLALDPATVQAGVVQALADPGRARYWLAQIDGLVVGQLMVTTEWSDWRNGWMWWIQSVYVEAASRGRGVYRALHTHVVETARRAGDVAGLRLYVEQANTRAQATYTALGMSRTHYQIFEQLLGTSPPQRALQPLDSPSKGGRHP